LTKIDNKGRLFGTVVQSGNTRVHKLYRVAQKESTKGCTYGVEIFNNVFYGLPV